MIRFSQSGNPIWSVPNDSPQIATADGGVIGASGITYDSQGRADGQIANMPIQSWTGNAYQNDPGQAQQVDSSPITEANIFWPFTNFWPLANANDSGNGTAKKLPLPDANHNHLLTIRAVSSNTFFGHNTVQVDNNQAVGFGPIDASDTTLLEGVSVPGYVYSRVATTIDAVYIYLTYDEAYGANGTGGAQAIINSWTNYPPLYNLYSRSCATFAEAVLTSTGFPAPMDIDPRKLIKDIRGEQIKENTTQAP